jgi:hypothetical protein
MKDAIIWNIALFALGVFVGWLTKVPWLRKWYREIQEEMAAHKAFCDRVIKRIDETGHL